MSDQFFDRLRARAVEIHVENHLRSRLARGEKLRIKLGLDPTAPDLHVGHLVLLDVLRDFVDEGHTVVVIIGDYTARIGDPSGRSETRPMLTAEHVAANAETYFQQVGVVLDRNKIEVRHNSEWLAGMTAADILRLTANATLQQVLQREDFADRMKSGTSIGAHEILYPFSQAYDSVAVNADLEVGGTDQLFNLLFGREIQKAYGQEPQDVAVFPLLEGTDGEQKMSKSLGNYIGIGEPPEQIYGKTMSIPDRLTEKYVRLISGLGEKEQAEVLALKPRDAKAALARQLVKRLHGEEASQRAEKDFENKFRNQDLDALRGTVLSMEFRMEQVSTAADVVLAMSWSPSFSQVKKQAEQGGLRVNSQKVAPEHKVQDGDVVQFGKKNFIRARLR